MDAAPAGVWPAGAMRALDPLAYQRAGSVVYYHMLKEEGVMFHTQSKYCMYVCVCMCGGGGGGVI